MKGIILRLFCLACMLATAMQTRSHTPFEALAGFFDTKKYRDFHITMTTAPDPYFGSVYVTMDHNYSSREKSITVCSDPAPMAELKANLTSDSFEEYGCRLHAYPRAGYALDGFVLKMNYRPGEDMSSYSLQLPLTLDNDNGRTGHFDELVPIPLAERTDLVSVADVMPAFPGGEQAMLDYISQNMRYPELAREMGIQGTVIVRFAVEKDGRISTPEVVKSVDRTLDREGLRLVGQMPKWSPGSVGGTPTGVIMMLPIRFK